MNRSREAGRLEMENHLSRLGYRGRYHVYSFIQHTVSVNPYKPSATKSSMPKVQTNRLGAIGFTLSASGIAGVIGGFILTAQFGVSVIFQLFIAISLVVCAIGFAVSCVGIFSAPRRFAILGALIGLYGSAHINTIWLAYLHSR